MPEKSLGHKIEQLVKEMPEESLSQKIEQLKKELHGGCTLKEIFGVFDDFVKDFIKRLKGHSKIMIDGICFFIISEERLNREAGPELTDG